MPHYGQSFDFTHVSHCTSKSMTLNFEAFGVLDQDLTPRDASSDKCSTVCTQEFQFKIKQKKIYG